MEKMETTIVNWIIGRGWGEVRGLGLEILTCRMCVST